MPPSRRVQAGALLFVLLMAASLGFSPAPGALARLGIGVLALALAGRALLTIVFQLGRAAVRRFEWAADGSWSVIDATGRPLAARLAPQTSALGPWILLVWQAGPDEWGRRGRRYALIDAAEVSQPAFRALRGRLKLLLPRPGQGSPP